MFVPSLPTLDPSLLLPTLEPPRAPRFPLDRLGQPSAHLFYLARAGVHHAIRHFLGPTGGTVLMPAYHHGVEVEAVRAAGATIAFYRVDSQMRADLDDLAARAVGDVRVVYVTHYAGFSQPVDEVADLCRARNLNLFEDCALALFSADVHGRPLGTTGDASVFCLYKTLPVPHGGLLVGRSLPTPSVTAAPVGSTLHHLAGQMLAHLELRAPDVGRPLRHVARRVGRATVGAPDAQTGTMHLQLRDLALGASPVVEHLCRRTDGEMVAVRRRRNFTRLAAELGDRFEVLGAPLPPGVCPLFVPIRVPDKPRLHAALQARGVDAIDFWSTGDPACDPGAFPEAAALRREILELPCHQSLDDEEIDAVAHAVREVALHA
jgi:dTDP-4-amino-4,6-dideoxygalactose transaminase